MAAKKRIAFEIDIIPHYRKTFYEKLCANQKYEWRVFFGSTNPEPGRPSYEGDFDFPNVPLVNQLLHFGSFRIRWQRGILKKVVAYNPDILIVTGISGILSNWLLLLWAIILRKKRLIWSCGWEAQALGSFALRIKRTLLRIYLSMAHSHLVYGRRAADYLIELGIKSDKITVCYNGIEIDHLLTREEEIRHAGQALREQEVGDQSTLFLYVGGMIPEKKVDLLIQSFMQLRKENEHCKLWLVGDGPERLRLGEIVKELNIPDITFWGRIVDGVDHYFAAADYFVLPGTGGLALNQALFWRVPCVVGEADGTEDDLVIDKVTGFRFQPEDPQSLKCALQKCLLLNCQERHGLGEEGRKLVVSRSNVSKMVQIFWSTLGKLEG